MGQDKALLPVGERSLLQNVCQVAQVCASKVLVVTFWVERYRDQIPSTCQLLQELPLPETDHPLRPHGPLVGFAQGLSQVQTEWVLLLACDLPQLKPDVLQAAIAQLEHIPCQVTAVLPKQQKGWEPLCGFYRSRCLIDLTNFIQQGGRSFQAWLTTQTVAELRLSDPTILFNCNTPEDWKTFQAAQDENKRKLNENPSSH